MRKEMKNDLLSLVPSLRAFAFCLTQDTVNADELVHSSLTEIWSVHADKKGVALKIGAFNALRRQFLRQVIVDPVSVQAFAWQWISVDDNAFKACFERLPRTEREALSLVDAWRFDQSEAAEICDCDRETIDRRLGMARSHLTSDRCKRVPIEAFGTDAAPILPAAGRFLRRASNAEVTAAL